MSVLSVSLHRDYPTFTGRVNALKRWVNEGEKGVGQCS